MKTYLYSYSWRGARYSLEIVAESEQEAYGRVLAIGEGRGLTYDGTLEAKVRADLPGAGLVARLLVWLGNLFRRGTE